MKAAIFKQYGGPEVVSVGELPTPHPKDDELLIKVHATTVSSGDWRIRSLNVPTGFGILVRLAFGLIRPRNPVLGTELAAEVVSTGRNVVSFNAGDSVLAFPGAQAGAHAEYIVMKEDAPIALKPENLSYEEAAALSFGGTTALDFLKHKAGIKPGDKVLINGASGAVGSAAVQLAKYFGAEVAAVSSSANQGLVKTLGADQFIDYTKEDFTQLGQRWDIIMDAVGNAPWSRVRPVLKENGRLLMIVAGLWETVKAPVISCKGSKQAISGTAAERPEDLRFLAELAEKGVFKPVIDRCYSLDEIVDAHTHVDSGRKRGNVVVKVAG